jgi:ATP-dependent RNA helicase DDX60
VCGPKLAARPKPKTEDKKHSKKVGGRAAALEAAKATAAKKNDKKNVTALANWKSTVERLEKVKTVQEQYLDAIDFLKGCSDEAEAAVGAEVRLYLCYKLWLLWESHRGKPTKNDALSIVAMLFDQLLRLSEQSGHTKQVIAAAKAIAGLAGLPVSIPAEAAPPVRPLPFTVDASPERAMPITTDPKIFQLAHSGPYMSRDFDSAPDSRVPFAPDAWQREVLDAIDDDKSLLVVAPTSAGKTFISFYAMKKTLQANHTDILVYVAPTKALVNQIAAEIAARFTKAYPGSDAGKSVWAIHTRDYRVNSAIGCQVLVTVPHVLQSMLLAPSNADRAAGWARRVRRIIFDEVHCIGAAEDGVVWEQLLLLAPCPIVALSATVGNANEFRDWLADAQAQKGYELKMVVHESRFSDLRKFIYHPPKTDTLPRLLVAPRYLPAPALDEGVYRSSDFRFVHPIAALLDL